MVTIVSANPQMLSGGINDLSIREVTPEAPALPSFLAKVFGFAKTGPLTPQLVVGNSRAQMYHADSFNERSKWATCATVLSNVLNSQGNQQMFQRLKPKDAGPNASLRITMDLLQTSVDEYQRNDDGTIRKNADGLPTPTGQKIPGYIGRLVARQVPQDDFGTAVEQTGEYNDGVNQSVSFPLFDLEVPHFGADGNNSGLRIWAQTAVGLDSLDDRILTNEGVYPFRMACLRRDDEMSSGRVARTNFNETSVQVAFKPGAIDRNTDLELYVGDVFLQNYEDFDNPAAPPKWGPFGKMAVYDDSIKKLLGLIYDAEAPYFDPDTSDAQGFDKEAELYLINLFGACSSRNVPYHAFILESSGADVMRASENSVVYAVGGSDGTMNEAVLNELIREEMLEYADPNSPVQDLVVNPESVMVDPGFELATKYALCNFIAVRRDTCVILSTHDVMGETLDGAQESSLGISLRTRLQLFPESELNGTHVCRGMVVGHSGEFLDSRYPRRLPLTLEIAKKAAAYMGAGNGRWKAGLSFDSAPRSVVSNFKNVNATFKPVSVRNTDWKNSLVTVQSFEMRSVFFPALKTVYDNDTSVLNSFFTMFIFCDLHKVGHRQWRNFTGSDKRSPSELKRDAEKHINDAVKDKYDNRVIIIPEVYYTKTDRDRGYVWRTRIKVGANNMTTVNVLELEAHRMEDLMAQQG